MSVKVILMYIFIISGKTTLTLVCTYMKVSGLDLDSFIWPQSNACLVQKSQVLSFLTAKLIGGKKI